MPLDAHPERLRYKDAAISKFGSDLASALPEIFSEIGGSEKAAFVPVPPSASKSSPEYDNRLVRILKETGMCIHFCEINIREAVILNGDYMASHKSGNFRISLNELMGIMRFVEGQSLSDFEHIFIFDDVITAGTHYKAVKNILLRHGCAEKDIYGLFLARTIDPKDDD
jgi:predicted amidophosphoribosyltransferase